MEQRDREKEPVFYPTHWNYQIPPTSHLIYAAEDTEFRFVYSIYHREYSIYSAEYTEFHRKHSIYATEGT